MNQVPDISTKKICLSLSDVVASLWRALLVEAMVGETSWLNKPRHHDNMGFKTNDLELYFFKVFRYKYSYKKLNFGYCNLFIRKDLLKNIFIKKGLKVWSGIFNLWLDRSIIGHLILPRVFPVGHNVQCVFCLVEQILILVGHCAMSHRYFKVWRLSHPLWNKAATGGVL